MNCPFCGASWFYVVFYKEYCTCEKCWCLWVRRKRVPETEDSVRGSDGSDHPR